MKRISIIEDEPDIANLVARNLRKEQFEVSVFHDGESFLRSLDNELPDLAILDLMLPGIDGLDVCKEMRTDERTRSVLIIILTAKGTELDIVLGLELGADDYITKPFSIRELIARVKAVLRRIEPSQQESPLVFDGLSVDLESFKARIDGSPEVKKALSGEIGSSVRYSMTLKEKMNYNIHHLKHNTRLRTG